MWAEVLPGPSVKKKPNGNASLIWDNCGTRNVPSWTEIYASINMECHNCPFKITDMLQVMDLVVNAPLKRAIRSLRCGALFECSLQFKAKKLEQSTTQASSRTQNASLIDGNLPNEN